MAFNRLLGNLATDLDSAASGTFLSKDDATSADFTSIAYSDLTGTPTVIDSALTTQLIDSSYVQLRQADAAVVGIDSATALVLFDSDYVGTRTTATQSGFKEYQYTATASQTVFKDSDNNGEILGFGSGGILVFYNGILMRKGSTRDYTEQTNQITLNAAADSGANVSIAKWQVNTVQNDFTFLGAGAGTVITPDGSVSRVRGGTADAVTDASNLKYQYERVDGVGDILSYSSLPAFDLNTSGSANNRIVWAMKTGPLDNTARVGISFQDNSGNRSNWHTYSNSLVHVFGTQTTSYYIGWSGFSTSAYFILTYEVASNNTNFSVKAKEVGAGNSIVTLSAGSSSVGYAPAYLTNNNSVAFYGGTAPSPIQGYNGRSSMAHAVVGIGTCPASISADEAIAQFETLMFK